MMMVVNDSERMWSTAFRVVNSEGARSHQRVKIGHYLKKISQSLGTRNFQKANPLGTKIGIGHQRAKSQPSHRGSSKIHHNDFP